MLSLYKKSGVSRKSLYEKERMISFVYVNGDVTKNLLCHYFSVNFQSRMEDKKSHSSGFLYTLNIML